MCYIDVLTSLSSDQLSWPLNTRLFIRLKMLISATCPRASAAAPSPTWSYNISSAGALRHVRRLPALISSMRNEVTLSLAQRQHQACLNLQSQVNQFTRPRSYMESRWPSQTRSWQWTDYIYSKSLSKDGSSISVLGAKLACAFRWRGQLTHRNFYSCL